MAFDPAKMGTQQRPNLNNDEFSRLTGRTPRDLRRIYRGMFGKPPTEGAKANAEIMARGTRGE